MGSRDTKPRPAVESLAATVAASCARLARAQLKWGHQRRSATWLAWPTSHAEPSRPGRIYGSGRAAIWSGQPCAVARLGVLRLDPLRRARLVPAPERDRVLPAPARERLVADG
jgi:hypothetical protein